MLSKLANSDYRSGGDTDAPFGDFAEEMGRARQGPASSGAQGRGGHGV